MSGKTCKAVRAGKKIINMVPYSIENSVMEPETISKNGAGLKSQMSRENQFLSIKGADAKQNVFMSALKFCVVLILIFFSYETTFAQIKERKQTMTFVEVEEEEEEDDLVSTSKIIYAAYEENYYGKCKEMDEFAAMILKEAMKTQKALDKVPPPYVNYLRAPGFVYLARSAYKAFFGSSGKGPSYAAIKNVARYWKTAPGGYEETKQLICQ